MNWLELIRKRAGLFFLLICLVCLVFYLGFLFGIREQVNGKDDQTQTILSNGFAENSLTQIEIRKIFGSSNGKDISVFGQMYFVINKYNQTEVLFRFDNAPIKVKQGNVERDIPQELRIDLAKKSANGLDYEYEQIGVIKFGNNEGQIRKANFSTILKGPIFDPSSTSESIQRIVFRPLDLTDPKLQNIFVNINSDLPLNVRGDKTLNIPAQPAPYFWITFTDNG